MSNDLLDFLTEGLHGRQRDAVTRAFYEYASGDIQSAPVGMAVLLTACARRMAQAPEELRTVTDDFRKLLTEGREMEARIQERVESSNAGVIAAFKDETRRASGTLREVVDLGTMTIDRGKRIDEKFQPVSANLERIGIDLYILKDDLKENRESARRMTEEAEKMQRINGENQMLFRHQGKEARANWITLGLFAGIFLSAMLSQMPWWGVFFAFAATIGLLQGLSRLSWDFVRLWIEGWKSPPAKSETAR